MKDIIDELDAIQRQVGQRRLPAGEGRTVVLRRRYDAPIEDVWDALTNPDRIPRWLMPVTGDFRLGGKYQLEGNAGGEIRRCEPPQRLTVTWVYGEAADPEGSEVDVQLSGGAGGTVLELTHAAVVEPEFWTQYGPGAVGVGWDLTLLGLALHLRDPDWHRDQWQDDSPEARQYLTGSSRAWGTAYLATGAPVAEVAAAVENTTQFYAPDPG